MSELDTPTVSDPIENAIKPVVEEKYLMKPKFILPFPTNLLSGTNLTDGFNGTPPGQNWLTVVAPQGGTNASVTIPIQGIEEATWPPRSFKVDKLSIISGTAFGKEQSVICSEEAPEGMVKVVYERQHHLALDAVSGINGCTITFSMAPPPGSSDTNYLNLSAVGGINKIAMDQLSDSKHVVATVNLALNAGWTLVSGSAHL